MKVLSMYVYMYIYIYICVRMYGSFCEFERTGKPQVFCVSLHLPRSHLGVPMFEPQPHIYIYMYIQI